MFYRHVFLGLVSSFFFFFNDTATTEIYTLSLHDALPISGRRCCGRESFRDRPARVGTERRLARKREKIRSEEHTSELQSLAYLVCRLLLEKKKKIDQRKAVQRRPNAHSRRTTLRVEATI